MFAQGSCTETRISFRRNVANGQLTADCQRRSRKEMGWFPNQRLRTSIVTLLFYEIAVHEGVSTE